MAVSAPASKKVWTNLLNAGNRALSLLPKPEVVSKQGSNLAVSLASEPQPMLVSRSTLKQDSLKGDVAVVSGAGRGIGFEASRALLWLGANVVVAEVDGANCLKSTAELQREFGERRAIGVRADIGREEDVANVARVAGEKFGHVDVVLNNATALTVGAVADTGIDYWDKGYRVNVRGPVLLAKAFLPAMISRRHGAFVCVSSSGAAPFMGAYEVFKTAQVELANTLAAELEGTGVYAFTIGPGIVRTPGFLEGGSKVAAMMGMTADQLLEMNKGVQLTVEEAGVGFAASVALAKKYNGTETSSVQVLREIGIDGAKKEVAGEAELVAPTERINRVVKTYAEQSKGWKERNLFQRQWVYRDFKKQTGMSVDEMAAELAVIAGPSRKRVLTRNSVGTLGKLGSYYKHQADLLRGFEKDPRKLEEGLRAIQSWIDEVQAVIDAGGSGK